MPTAILIIGCEGFIGSHLTQHFLRAGFNVVGCDMGIASQHSDIRYVQNDQENNFWDHLFEQHKPDVCINAGGSGNVGYSMQHPLKDFMANCYAVISILDAVRKVVPACKYVHLSSAAIYGNPQHLPVKEDDCAAPLSPYGWHKLLSENICKEYKEIYGIKTAIVRPFSVYGNGLRKQLPWDVCQKLEAADNISLFGTGNESRDFIHIDDLARLINIIIETSVFNGDVYNAACGKEVTINLIATAIAANFSGNKTITFSGEIKQGDPINWRADTTKLDALGFKPLTKLEDGLASYVNWYMNIINEQ